MKLNLLIPISLFVLTTLNSCKKEETTTPPRTETYTASTFAGSTQGFADGTGTSIQFSNPSGLAKDASGNIFVADRDNHRIRKITPAGSISTFAGSGTAGLQDGAGAIARFNQPYGLTIDAAGNLYVADRMNYCIRKITATGVVSTLAGSTNGFADGAGTSAQFSELYGICIDGSGNLYVPDFFNNRIRKVTATGVVTTLAGNATNGFTNGAGTAASFYNPFQTATDAAGNVYVADYYNHAIRKITPAGVVTTLAGSGTAGSADGTGAAASFRQPGGLTVDANGNVYVADVYNNKIRKITPAGIVSTVAGGSGPGNTNGIGTAALFDSPLCILGDFTNNAIYVSEYGNHRIRKIVIQ